MPSTNYAISATPPSNPDFGYPWYDLNAETWKTWNGFQWVSTTSKILGAGRPLQEMLDTALRTGKLFTASTGLQAVASSSYLNYLLTNPAGSGVNVFLYERSWYNNIVNGGAPVEWGQQIAPVGTIALTSPTAVTPANFKSGSPIASACSFGWRMGTANNISAANVGGTLPTGGQRMAITAIRLLPPGYQVGVYVGGSGGGLAQAARLGGTHLWWEEAA